MKSILGLLVSLAITSAIFLVRANAGTFVGNGTDRLPEYLGSAWFLGESRTVKWCVETDPMFEIPFSQAQATISASVTKWTKYLARRGANDGRAAARRLTFQFQFEECSSDIDLKFMLGTPSSEIASIYKLYRAPKSISHIVSFDDENGWAKGIVWLGSSREVGTNWTAPFVLEAMLTHELGNIFGTGFINGTVRQEDLAEILTEKPMFANLLTTVDRVNSVLTCDGCTVKFKEHRTFYIRDEQKMFSEVLGFAVGAETIIEYRSDKGQRRNAAIEIFSNGDRDKLYLKLTGKIVRVENPYEHINKTYLKKGGVKFETTYSERELVTITSRRTLKEYTGFVLRNAKNAFEVTAIVNGKPLSIARAQTLPENDGR